MNKISILLSLFLLPLLASSAQKQVYIVHFGEDGGGEKVLHEIEDTHHSYLLSLKESEEEARASLVYSYKHSINGFAAMLTPDQASKLSELEEVASVYKSEPGKYSAHTTRSWQFVGLEETHKKKMSGDVDDDDDDDMLVKASYGKDVIVGVLDSGAWPESKSFSDEGMGPVPKSWNGICQTGVDDYNGFHCNKKIIGARYYLKGYEQYYGHLNVSEDCPSPRDLDGHGTHTASTVAGRRVPEASALGGFARGTASGGAPLARLAIYKACWAIPNATKADGNTCFEADMLAAMDDAIADGVHVMSISIGSTRTIPFTQDGIAMGALNAVKNNVVVACSAGNSGPTPGTLSNTAPWIITVSASSVDRAFFAPLLLENGQEFLGQTVTPYKLEKMHPLVYAEDVVVPGVAKNVSSQCLPGSLSPEKVKGKIVMCMRGLGMRVEKGQEVKRAGGVGFVLGNSPANGNELACDAHLLPATAVGYDDAVKILKYINSTKNPMAFIKQARTTLNYQPAPFMAAFTSRGPNVLDPNILKPDITAPGLNILAAWSTASSPSKLSEDKRSVDYNIDSGTSMACPHVAAAAALLKAIHPNWSSAAIRSALMTTAWMKNNEGLPISEANGNLGTPFTYGSGHFRPIKAMDPGLVYDASYNDYLLYLCSSSSNRLNDTNLTFKCPKVIPSAANLNYPSLAIPNLNGTVIVKRTVTNVGSSSKSVYFFTAKPPLGVSVKATPNLLFFNRVGQKKSFTITVRARRGKHQKNVYGFGWYTWTDGHYYVRSPMAVSLA